MQWGWLKRYKNWLDLQTNYVYSKPNELELQEKQALLQEIWKAKREWQVAHARLEWALGQDQVDYSIYVLEAAEKRYEMLLKQAKQRHWDNTPILLERESG